MGEQVVYKKYGIDDNFGKNNKSMILNENKNNFSEKMVNKKSKNKNICTSKFSVIIDVKAIIKPWNPNIAELTRNNIAKIT